MKLIEIWNAQEALSEVKKLRKSCKVSYDLMKHMKTLNAEIDICEAERLRLVYEITGVEPGQPVSIEPNTQEYEQFLKQFSEFLQQECEVKPFPMTLDELVQHVSVAGNTLSEDTLFRMEPLMRPAD